MMDRHTFRFKQFVVRQRDSAMKVGTDGVLLGSWAVVNGCSRIWDVGCGTGLIALMMAQRSNALVSAVELDLAAANEARWNVEQSPWSERIDVHCGDVFDLSENLPHPDLIVCNPPFFTQSLQAPDEARAKARHEASLGCASLIRLATRVLTEAGRLCFIAPADRCDDIILACALEGLYIARQTEVCGVVGKSPVRILWEISRDKCSTEKSSISIRLSDGSFTPEYIELTKDFYLKF